MTRLRLLCYAEGLDERKRSSSFVEAQRRQKYSLTMIEYDYFDFDFDYMDPGHPDPGVAAGLLYELSHSISKALESSCGLPPDPGVIACLLDETIYSTSKVLISNRGDPVRNYENILRELTGRVKLVVKNKSQLEADLSRPQNDLTAPRRDLDEADQRRCNLEQMNCQLKSEIEQQQNTINGKDEIWKILKQSTETFRDCIREEKEQQYEEERKAREALEKKLRDFEENKRLQQKPMAQKTHNCSSNSPCYKCDADRLESHRYELQNARRCLELEKQLEDAQMERSVWMCQIQGWTSSQQQQETPVSEGSIALAKLTKTLERIKDENKQLIREIEDLKSAHEESLQEIVKKMSLSKAPEKQKKTPRLRRLLNYLGLKTKRETF